MREGAGRSGEDHLTGPISSEEPERRPIMAQEAAARVGCWRAARVADAERSGPSRLLCRFPRAPYSASGAGVKT